MAKKRSLISDPHVLFLLVCTGLVIIGVVYLSLYGSRTYLLEKEQFKAQQMIQALNGREPTTAELDRVIAQLEKAIAKSPLSSAAAQLHFTIARLYYGIAKDYPKAIDELKKVLLNFSNSPQFATEARFQMGKMYEMQDNWDAALKVYKDIYEYHPLSQKGLYTPLYIAEAYKARGQDAEAKEAYQAALNQYNKLLAQLGDISDSAIVMNYIALVYASEGLWEKAAEQWEAIVKKYEKSPIIPATLMTLGEVYANRLKERTKAIEAYTRVIADYPESDLALQAHIRLIQLYFATSDYANARLWCEKLLANEKAKDNRVLRAETSLLLARSYEKEGNWAEADRIYNTVTKEYADTAAAMRVPLIRAKHFQDDAQLDEANRLYQEAMVEYQRVVAQHPDSRVAVNAQDLMSLIYVNKQDWPGLITHVDSLLKETKEGTQRHAQLLFLKGNILRTKLNEPEAAKAVYNQFLVLYGDQPLADTVAKQLAELENPAAVSTASSDTTVDKIVEKLAPGEAVSEEKASK